MTLAKALLATIGNVPLPTITNTYNARRGTNFTDTLSIGTPSLDRLVILSLSDQSNNKTWAPTLDGQSPDFSSSSDDKGVHFSIWKFPDGTTGTIVTNANASQTGGVSLYSVTGWDGFAVLDFKKFHGGDSLDFFHTVPVPLPENTILLGVWSTNEDGSAIDKIWNFGFDDRFAASGSQEDAGSAFDILEAADPSLDVECDSSGKRRAYGFLALGSGNLA